MASPRAPRGEREPKIVVRGGRIGYGAKRPSANGRGLRELAARPRAEGLPSALGAAVVSGRAHGAAQ
jgi:hypothetical protein